MNGIQLTLARTQNKFASVTASIVVWLVVWQNFCSEKISSTTEHQHASVWELNLLVDTGVLRWNTDWCKKWFIYVGLFWIKQRTVSQPQSRCPTARRMDEWEDMEKQKPRCENTYLSCLLFARSRKSERYAGLVTVEKWEIWQNSTDTRLEESGRVISQRKSERMTRYRRTHSSWVYT